MAKDVKSGMVKTASGSSFKMKVSKKGVHVDKAKVVATDVMADNGVIHVIDTVIIPKSKYSTKKILKGDNIEILQMIGGG